MTFLSTGLLAGLLATAVPVLLHLLAKQQPKRIVFPATRFLKATLDTQRDRIKIRRWWLMAMRILAIGLLALALARPQIATSVADAWFILAICFLAGVALLGLATAAWIARQSKSIWLGCAMLGLLVLLSSSVYAGYLSIRSPAAVASDQSPAAIAIVIDNSIRSSRRMVEGTTGNSSADTSVLSRMKQLATEYLEQQTADSVIAVIDRSARPATFSLDRSTAISRIGQLQPQSLAEPLVDRIRSAVSLVRSSSMERRTVLLVTDLTAASLVDREFAEAGLEELLAQEPVLQLQLLDVGQTTAFNGSISKVTISDLTPPRLSKTDVAVTLVNPTASSTIASDDATALPSTISVELELYQTQLDAAQGLPVLRDSEVVLPPKRSVDRVTVQTDTRQVETLLTIPPLDVGIHHGSIRMVLDDDFAADNIHYFTLSVNEPKRILLLGADVEERKLLANAITAPLAMTDPLAEFRVDVAEFLPSTDTEISQYDLLVWIDPALPTPPQMSELDSFVARGGNLILLLGPSLASNDMEQNFVKGLERIWRAPEPGEFFEVIRPSHPSVKSLRDIVGGVPWSAFRVHRYWQIQTTSDDTIIARFAGSGHPALIERTVAPENSTGGIGSAGVKLLLTTPLPALRGETRDWNDLFSGSDAWPSFLLFRDMVDAAVYRDRSSSNLGVGENAMVKFPSSGTRTDSASDPSSSESNAGSTRAKAQLFPPTGLPQPVTIAPDGKLMVSRLDQAGTYWLKATAGLTGFSVNHDRTQLPLDRIDRSRLESYFGAEHFVYARTLDEIRTAEGHSQPTRPLYPMLLMLMLIAFALEQTIANRFYAVRATAAAGGR